ncbi:hypothetical protein EVAR_54367_1 [Eumeta japonica]|uniref:Uncharacterized protein n=1 Tax=Eumeta variegata TaxID=151549 RepID=A0A4C1Y7L4_EUMVA|nr:hypothetical protein EVAR_54367_1 [Eumeta japonica]
MEMLVVTSVVRQKLVEHGVEFVFYDTFCVTVVLNSNPIPVSLVSDLDTKINYNPEADGNPANIKGQPGEIASSLLCEGFTSNRSSSYLSSKC